MPSRPDSGTLHRGASDPAAITRSELTRGKTAPQHNAIGRYLIIGELGRGGMGRVLRGYDPKLQREVAIKVLASSAMDPLAHARLLREARTMAQLSHPNVVAVYDVENDPLHGVILAMELVTGTTLRRWLRKTTREWPELLRVFSLAGRGLAAAHDEGLLHRDFKPSNVLVSDEGRVKVTDFGLAKAGAHPFGPESLSQSQSRSRESHSKPTPSGASEVLTDAGTVLGTPRYMAPEQHLGGALTPAADQFAFCVALWEALTGTAPYSGRDMATAKSGGPPPWPATHAAPRDVVEALRRGLSPAPSERWPTMDDLLGRLAHDPAARRRRWLTIGGIVGALGVGIVGSQASEIAGQSRTDNAIEACEREGQAIEAIWDPVARAKVRSGLLATEASYARTTADNVMPWIDEQARSWAEARTEACLDRSVRGSWTSETLDRSLWCLDERHAELSSLIDQLARADADIVRQAVGAASGLDPVAPCRDEVFLASQPPPPRADDRTRLAAIKVRLSEAKTTADAGNYTDALERVRAARNDMETLDWPPLLARIGVDEASLLDRLGEYEQAEQVGVDAYFQAMNASAWGTASDAAAVVATIVGNRQARHQEGRLWIRQAEAAETHAGDPAGLRRALRLGVLATIEEATDNTAEARALHSQALAIKQEVLGQSHPRLTVTLNALASTYFHEGRYEDAAALYDRTLALSEQTYGPDHPQVAATLQNRAAVKQAMGAYVEAKDDYGRALQILERALGPEHPKLAKVVSNIATARRLTGDLEGALAANKRALTIVENGLGPTHPRMILVLNNLATVEQAMGHPERARPHLRQALTISEEVFGADHPAVAPLLNNLAALHDDPQEAIPLLERGLAIAEKAMGAHHPDVAFPLVGLADAKLAKGDYAEAQALHERALKIREDSLGLEHPKLAHPLNGLARIAIAQRHPAHALRHAERSVAIVEAAQVAPDLLAESRQLLAQALWDAPPKAGQDRSRAVEVARQALHDLAESDGPHAVQATLERWLQRHHEGP